MCLSRFLCWRISAPDAESNIHLLQPTLLLVGAVLLLLLLLAEPQPGLLGMTRLGVSCSDTLLLLLLLLLRIAVVADSSSVGWPITVDSTGAHTAHRQPPLGPVGSWGCNPTLQCRCPT